MNIEYFKTIIDERLTTRELVGEAARIINVSTATMYRYKRDPAAIPFGKLVALGKYLAFPIEGTVAWSRADVIQGERRRLQLEFKAAKVGGSRFTVTPSYSVNAELPEMTRQLWEFDYPGKDKKELETYLHLRSSRHELYVAGQYQSLELLSGSGYMDLFYGRGRFKDVPDAVRKKQITAFLKTMEYPHVQRRVYLKHTPELPVITCYSTNIAVIRVDDITIEFNDTPKVSELIDVYNHYFKNADIISKDRVAKFLENPSKK